MVQPELFDLDPARRCSSCNAPARQAPPYRVGDAWQYRWSCDRCNASGLDSVRASGATVLELEMHKRRERA